jgi:competence protein ComGC
MPKILLIVSILFLTLPGFGQEGSGPADTGKVIIRETPAPEEAPAAPAVIEEDADLAELNAIRQKQLEKAKMLQKTTDPLKDPLGNPAEQLMKLTKGQISAAMLMDDKIQVALSRLFSEGYMSRASREETVKLLRERVKGSFFEKIFLWFPSVLEISVDIVRDAAAMPGLIKILGRKDDLKTFGYIWIAIFIFGLLIKNRLIKPKWPFLKRRLCSLSISLPLYLATIYIFYSMFTQELVPTLAIVGKYWF